MNLPSKPSSTTAVLKNYNFCMLWIGQGTSLLGDTFFMIALPWLVLKLTDDPLALGTILALMGIPRALFMLVGGAVTDRFSARGIMLASDLLRLALTLLLAILIFSGGLQLWILYLLALLFGVISGFFTPASAAMLPLLVQPEELAPANSIYQGTAYLTSFIGPVLAGGLIALFAHAGAAKSVAELTGIAAAVAVDAFTFVVSVITLLLMRWQGLPNPPSSASSSLLESIREGIRFAWRDDLLRTLFILMVAANFLVTGPLLVGIPVLANSRLAGGAAAYGTIVGAYGGGNLLGVLLATRVILALGKRMSVFIIAVVVSFGVVLSLLGLVRSTPLAFALLLVMGIGNGVLSIALITFLQRQTPKEMLGRVMSLVMLAGVGLVPVSQALVGGLINLNLTGLFVGAGVLMLLVSVWFALQPVMPTLSRLLAEGL